MKKLVSVLAAVALVAAVPLAAFAQEAPAPEPAPAVDLATAAEPAAEPDPAPATAPAAEEPASVASIETPADLLAFADSVNAGVDYEGKTVALQNDLDMAGKTWAPVGMLTSLKPLGQGAGTGFNGTFDGNDHEIVGLSSGNVRGGIDAHRNLLALFAVVSQKGTVQNLRVNADLVGTNAVAGIIAVNFGTVQDCSFSGSLHSDEKTTVWLDGPASSGTGGIAAISYGTVRSCEVRDATIYRGGAIAGGIVGSNHGDIFACRNVSAVLTDGPTKYPASSTAQGGVGGIAGESNASFVEGVGGTVLLKNPQIADCLNSASVSGYQRVGGIVGSANHGVYRNCLNTGGVAAQSMYAGGVAGSLTQSQVAESTIESCSNAGAVDAASRAGGICGGTDFWPSMAGDVDDMLKVANCLNEGPVSGSNYVGGMVGNSQGLVSSCFNTGSTVARGAGADNPTYVGGVAGGSSGSVEDCGNAGDVRCSATGDDVSWVYAGGVAGSGFNTGTIARSYNRARVLIDADVPFVKNYIYPGGVVGSVSGDAVTDSYYCAELAGDALSLNPAAGLSDQGTPAQDMLGLRAQTKMPGLLFAPAGAWTASAPVESGQHVYVTSPYLASAGTTLVDDEGTSYRMSATTAALIDAAYFVVTLPQGEGYAVVPASGQEVGAVLAGGDFSFTVSIADGYAGDAMRVSSNGKELLPDANGVYVIASVSQNQQVSVEGVKKVDPNPQPMPQPAPLSPDGPAGDAPKVLAATGDNAPMGAAALAVLGSLGLLVASLIASAVARRS